MINAATTTAAARIERLESGQQFLIPHPEENSWGKEQPLDKERIIREIVEFTHIMNKRRNEECMSIFLDKGIVNGTSWALMISLDLEVISEYGYRFKKMRIQTKLLDLLRDLPVCAGLGVKGDVHEIEQFYMEWNKSGNGWIY